MTRNKRIIGRTFRKQKKLRAKFGNRKGGLSLIYTKGYSDLWHLSTLVLSVKQATKKMKDLNIEVIHAKNYLNTFNDTANEAKEELNNEEEI
jgi:hypothetical protein